jgi:hypothetical protein
MKIFVYEGKGIYLTATVVIVAENKKDAEKLLRERFEKERGMNIDSDYKFKEHPVNREGVVYFYNGDY